LVARRRVEIDSSAGCYWRGYLGVKMRVALMIFAARFWQVLTLAGEIAIVVEELLVALYFCSALKILPVRMIAVQPFWMARLREARLTVTALLHVAYWIWLARRKRGSSVWQRVFVAARAQLCVVAMSGSPAARFVVLGLRGCSVPRRYSYDVSCWPSGFDLARALGQRSMLSGFDCHVRGIGWHLD